MIAIHAAENDSPFLSNRMRKRNVFSLSAAFKNVSESNVPLTHSSCSVYIKTVRPERVPGIDKCETGHLRYGFGTALFPEPARSYVLYHVLFRDTSRKLKHENVQKCAMYSTKTR